MVARAAGAKVEQQIVPCGVRAGSGAQAGPRVASAAFRAAQHDAVVGDIDHVAADTVVVDAINRSAAGGGGDERDLVVHDIARRAGAALSVDAAHVGGGRVDVEGGDAVAGDGGGAGAAEEDAYALRASGEQVVNVVVRDDVGAALYVDAGDTGGGGVHHVDVVAGERPRVVAQHGDVDADVVEIEHLVVRDGVTGVRHGGTAMRANQGTWHSGGGAQVAHLIVGDEVVVVARHRAGAEADHAERARARAFHHAVTHGVVAGVVLEKDRAASAGACVAQGQIPSAAAEASVNGHAVRAVERDEARRRASRDRAHRRAVWLNGQRVVGGKILHGELIQAHAARLGQVADNVHGDVAGEHACVERGEEAASAAEAGVIAAGADGFGAADAACNTEAVHAREGLGTEVLYGRIRRGGGSERAGAEIVRASWRRRSIARCRRWPRCRR